MATAQPETNEITGLQPRPWRSLADNLYRGQNPIILAFAYLVVLTLVEVIAVLFYPRLGVVLNLMMLIILLVHAAMVWDQPIHKFLITLAFVPLIRVVSLSLPLVGFPIVYWYFFTSLPLFAAAFVVIRMQGLGLPAAGNRQSNLLLQIPLVLIGLGLGYAEYIILRPDPLVENFSWAAILIPALILLISTGLLEEVVFRGLMQGTSTHQLGKYLGILYVAVLFAVLHIGYKSVLDVVFVFVVGLGFGLIVAATGSLLGVTMAHGLTNIMLFLILPFVAAGELSLGGLTIPGLPSEETAVFQRVGIARPSSANIEQAYPIGPEPAVVLANLTATPTASIEPTPVPTRKAPAVVPSVTELPSTVDGLLVVTPVPTMPVEAPTIAPTHTPFATMTQSPSSTPEATLTPAATDDIFFSQVTSSIHVNIRRGPGPQYLLLELMSPDKPYSLIGRNTSGNWLQICCTVLEGNGWVWSEFLTANIDILTLPIVPAPPLLISEQPPTPVTDSPLPTFQPPTSTPGSPQPTQEPPPNPPNPTSAPPQPPSPTPPEPPTPTPPILG